MSESLDRVAEKLGILQPEECDMLPADRLRQLATHGVILSVMTFEDHMNPTVHWIEPEEFGAAFEELVATGKVKPA